MNTHAHSPKHNAQGDIDAPFSERGSLLQDQGIDSPINLMQPRKCSAPLLIKPNESEKYDKNEFKINSLSAILKNSPNIEVNPLQDIIHNNNNKTHHQIQESPKDKESNISNKEENPENNDEGATMFTREIILQIPITKDNLRKPSNLTESDDLNRSFPPRKKISQRFTKEDAHNTIVNTNPYPMMASSIYIRKENSIYGGHKHGSFLGVLLPTCENMWGVLVFLRFYCIVGQAGVLHAILICLLCYVNALLTSSSLSAMATSGGAVAWGGPFHMLSKTLGLLLGVTIGIFYFLGNTLLSVLETLGAVETFLFSWDEESIHFTFNAQAFGLILFFLMIFVIFLGQKMVAKMSYIFAIIVVLTILSLVVGILVAPSHTDNDYITGWKSETFKDNFGPDYDDNMSFAGNLGIFFPCFAAILSGASRSKNLSDPKKNIPRGTFGAITISFILYCILFILWGGVAPRSYLKGKDAYIHPSLLMLRMLSGGPDGGQVIMDIAYPVAIVCEIGIIISSISQALQCLMVAPRLFSRISKTNIISCFKVFGVLRKGEPLRALLLTSLIGAPILLTGSVDIVAPILSMCFLITFVFINFSTFIMTLLRPPSWRPYKINHKRWRLFFIVTSILGCGCSVGIMFIINWMWATGVILAGIGLYMYVSWINSSDNFGSAIKGLLAMGALNAIRKLKENSKYSINWRPQILVILRIHSNKKSLKLIKIAEHFRKAQGLFIIAGVIKGNPKDPDDLKKLPQARKRIDEQISNCQFRAFSEVIVSLDFLNGLSHILQITGLGGLVPNTVLLSWPTNWQTNQPKAIQLVDSIYLCTTLGMATILIKDIDSFSSIQENEMKFGTIDIWWIINDGGLMLLLSYFLKQYKSWRKCVFRIFLIGDELANSEKDTVQLKKVLYKLGIKAEEVRIVILEEELYEPYIRSWSLKRQQRHKLLDLLKKRRSNVLPNLIDSLHPIKSLQPRKKPSRHDMINTFRESIFRKQSRKKEYKQNSDDDDEEEKSPLSDDSAGSYEKQNEAPQDSHNQTELEISVEIKKRERVGRVYRKYKKINDVIKENSLEAELVIINLPDPVASTASLEHKKEYMAYIDLLAHDIKRVLFIHGRGDEIIEI